MTLVDVILLVVLIGYAISGFRQGLVVGALSVAAFFLGAVIGMSFLPGLLAGWEPGRNRTFALVGGVLVLAWIGHVLGALVGRRLRDVVSWKPVRYLDSSLGAVAGVVVVCLVLWFVAGALRGGPVPALSREVASSSVLRAIDRVVPPGAARLFSSFRSVVEAKDFPRVFSGLEAEPIEPVEPPDPSVVGPVAAAAAGGIVKVTGLATACDRGREGSGFVVAKGRVVTNAHVVAGVQEPSVQVTGQGDLLPGRVVLFDARRDLAVIAVPDLTASPLPLGPALDRGGSAVVAGFPLDGPYTSVAARVREVLQASGQDIYGSAPVVREVYSLATTVSPGNSGGPLLDPEGRVTGVVFARSLDDAGTGYAMTLAEAQPVLTAAPSLSETVPTGGCTNG